MLGRAVWALGGLYVVIGAVQVQRDLQSNGPLGEILVDSVLFGGLALALFYGGYRVRHSDLPPDRHPRIAGWCVGGLLAMSGVTGLLMLNPDASIGHPLREIGFHTGIGSIGGLAVGLMEARAITRAEDAERSERALEESKRELRALIDALPVAVFVAEADGEIVEWNEAAEEIWGGEVVESDSIAEYAEYDGWWADTGEPVAPDEWPLARALDGEEVTDPDEIEIEGFDGELRTVLNHGMPIRDADGEVTRAVVTLVDITERKEYQRRLEESNERLEQFAYAASHDLQEPLRMVSSYLQMLESRYEEEIDEDGREFLEFAVDGAERMREMIDGLLAYSQVETRGDPFEPVDLEAVVKEVRQDLRFRIEETDADVTVDPLPCVRGDPDQLRQVFQNLLENAIEYSDDESPRIHVASEPAGDGTERVISVEDDGIGIDDEHQERIFEVFQRLHNREDYEGTGIGLALCERIVERHGGDMWVESEPGAGSTFYFTIPAGEARPAATTESGSPNVENRKCTD